MRWRGVHHVEFAVLDYDDSIVFYDAMFGWLGYMSFWTLDIDYRSTYYMTRFPAPHSFIGIQPARTGSKLHHTDQAVGINHVALWARSRKEVDRFYREFLIGRGIRVTTTPRSTPITGRATTPYSSTTRSTASIGNWRGYRKFCLPARSGVRIERWAKSHPPATTCRTLFPGWLARPCDRSHPD